MANEDEEAPEWAKREIAAAVEILKSDGVHIHRTYKSFMDSQQQETPEPDKDKGKGKGQAPPVKETTSEVPAKRSMWWGSRTNDD